VKILGISAFYHDSAAALIVDGKIIAAAQEERFTRKKHDSSFPANAIKFCMNYEALGIDDLDAVVFYDKPLLMTSSAANDMYKNADHFGPMLLVTPEIPDNISDRTSISKLKVYPVPAHNTLAIDLSANETRSYTITISTLTGQVVYREQFVGIKQELNIESFDKGIYLLEVLSNQNKFSRLIIKE
jgi:predicted NodU family carbamoyl transferase